MERKKRVFDDIHSESCCLFCGDTLSSMLHTEKQGVQGDDESFRSILSHTTKCMANKCKERGMPTPCFCSIEEERENSYSSHIDPVLNNKDLVSHLFEYVDKEDMTTIALLNKKAFSIAAPLIASKFWFPSHRLQSVNYSTKYPIKKLKFEGNYEYLCSILPSVQTIEGIWGFFCEHKVDLSILPTTAKELIMYGAEQQYLDAKIPSQITTLELTNCKISPAWPPGLLHLTTNSARALVNLPETLKTLSVTLLSGVKFARTHLPSNLQKATLTAMIDDPEQVFPNSLVELFISTVMQPIAFPNSLQHLTISSLRSTLVLPPQLTSLSLSKFESLPSLPDSLTHLDIQSSDFNPLTLPPNLRFLRLGLVYQLPLPLPPSLTHLDIRSRHFNHALSLPTGLIHLSLGKIFNQPLHLPRGLKYLKLGKKYASRVALLPPTAWGDTNEVEHSFISISESQLISEASSQLPPTLQTVIMHTRKPMRFLSLPASLTTIKFKTKIEIVDRRLPPELQNVTFLGKKPTDLLQFVLPVSLKTIVVSKPLSKVPISMPNLKSITYRSRTTVEEIGQTEVEIPTTFGRNVKLIVDTRIVRCYRERY